LQRISITNGLLQTPEGIRYKALALPHSRILPLAVLKLAEKYLQNGGTLIGERPLHSQGIVPPDEAQQFNSIADRLWSDCERNSDKHITIGRGQLFCMASAREALRAMEVLPDMEETGRGTALDYVHRRAGEADIYFLRNTQDKPIETTVLLRVKDRQPEIFHPDTGDVEESLLFSTTSDGRTMLPLSLEARGSVFVIFRHDTTLQHVKAIERDGVALYSSEYPEKTSLPQGIIVRSDGTKTVLSTPDPGRYRLTFADAKSTEVTMGTAEPIDVPGPWTLDFPSGWGAPPQIRMNRLSSWTNSSDAGVRYFSGRVTYRTILRLTKAQAAIAASAKLNLGEVHEVAAVRINGKAMGILWKQPYTIRIDGLHAGLNTIEVDVTNLWPNRLIGDAQDPDAKHYTWTNIRKYRKDSPLLPSGMLGPVSIEPEYTVILHTPLRTNSEKARKDRE
jgi:hypothetical protein